jgi:peptide deformylase
MENDVETDLLPIVIWPNRILTKVAAPVEKIDGDIIELSRKMITTMNSSDIGVGLAAPQVGESIRMIVIDPVFDPEGLEGVNTEEPFALINPSIEASEGSFTDDEGCLSLPGLYYPIERPERIEFQFTTIDGDEVNAVATDFMAKLICHEIDHLDGKLLWDNISRFKREWLKTKFKKMMANEK